MVSEYYDSLESVLTEFKLQDKLKHTCIYNVDETGMSLNPSKQGFVL